MQNWWYRAVVFVALFTQWSSSVEAKTAAVECNERQAVLLWLWPDQSVNAETQRKNVVMITPDGKRFALRSKRVAWMSDYVMEEVVDPGEVVTISRRFEVDGLPILTLYAFAMSPATECSSGATSPLVSVNVNGYFTITANGAKGTVQPASHETFFANPSPAPETTDSGFLD